MDRLEQLKQKMRDSLNSLVALVVYLSSLRDYNTGRYSHAGWAYELSEEESSNALRKFHAEQFEELLSLPAANLAEELGVYFATLHVPVEKTVGFWQGQESFQALVPERCHPVDRGFFFSTVRAALAVLAVRIQHPSLAPRSS